MRILFFTDNFPPESNAPASRTYEHAIHWVRAGHEVTVVTCAPNFPTGKVFPGYRNRLWQKENIDGIEVIRLWSYMTANNGFAKRTLDYLSFMIMAMIASPFLRRPDVIVGTSPQFFTLLAAWFASLIKARPWILELRDIWPESIKAVDAFENSIVFSALEKLEMFLYRRAARIVAVTYSFKETLVDRGIPAEKIAVVTNGVELAQFTSQPKDPDLVEALGLEGKFVAGYVGTHGMAHALETILKAAETLNRNGHSQSVAFLFVGEGARREALERDAAARNLTNVRFVGPVPKQEVSRYWSVLDVSIIHLKDTELFGTTIPSKLFECMGMGLPVLLGLRGEAKRIVEQYEFGECFPPEDDAALASAIATLAPDPARLAKLGRNARVAAPNYDRHALAGRMIEEFSATLPPPSQTAPRT